MPAPFAILGIDHVVLRATDPAALEHFYLEVLGCTLEKRQGTLTQLRAGAALIDIVPADEAGPAGGTSRSCGANLDPSVAKNGDSIFDSSQALPLHIRPATMPAADFRRQPIGSDLGWGDGTWIDQRQRLRAFAGGGREHQ